jgi:hypothetical protein
MCLRNIAFWGNFQIFPGCASKRNVKSDGPTEAAVWRRSSGQPPMQWAKPRMIVELAEEMSRLIVNRSFPRKRESAHDQESESHMSRSARLEAKE